MESTGEIIAISKNYSSLTPASAAMGGSCPKELVSMELLVSIAETAQGCGGHWS